MSDRKVYPHLTLMAFLGVIVVLVLIPASSIVIADHTPDPSSVTIAGSLQSELGCPGDWQPECASTHLGYDADDDVWQATFTIPAGSWEYKAALNDSWDENYGAGAQQNGPNIGLNLESATGVKFYYDHESHWVTDNVNSVIAVVPGNFQDELGCPGDWQPDCLRSWLQDPDGDGIYSFVTADIPPGDYEAKVAHNESWDENYGAGGVQNGPNIPFTVEPEQAVRFTYDLATHILVIGPAGLEPGDENLVRPVIQHRFQDEVLYFAIPDRFNNGDPNNNCGSYAGPCVENDTQENVLTHGYLPSDRGYYHGGDLAGLEAKLDYLAEMGVTAVWVGPIYLNNTVQPDSSNLYGYSSGYHGYWILDFEQVDPHLGNNVEFQSLVGEAHARGIKVFMDIITNHTADVIELEGNAGYRNKTDFPYLDVNGQPFDDSDFAYNGQPDYTFPEVNEDSFPYRPLLPAGQENVKNPAWLNDPLFYHNRGNSEFASESSLYGDFFGLDDLWSERKEVVDGMIAIFSGWIEDFGVDGFRIDTTKHVNMEFWQKFGPDIQAAAEDAGIGDFFAFGEVFDQQYGPSFLSEFSTRGRLQSTIDFSFQLAARNYAAQGGTSEGLGNFFELDDYYTDADSNAYAQPTFLGNHDMGRIGYFLQQVDQVGANDAELLARDKLAHALMFFSRGQPVIYYGDEQGFTGDGGDKLARQDMFPSQVPEYNDDDLIGTDSTTADDNFDPFHPIYQALANYAGLYQGHRALRYGAQIHRFSVDSAGIYAFSRIDRDEKVEYVVAFNNAEVDDSATFGTASPNTTFTQIYPGDGGPLDSGADGTLTVTVPGLDFVIYQAQSPIPDSPAAPSILISNLVNNQEVPLLIKNQDGHDIVDRLEVVAELGSDVFAEVTFAASVNGDAYEPIGTDNNPPYRVFYDVTSLPEGASVSFKAIVDDLSGNLNAAKVSGIVPIVQEPAPPGGGAAYAVIHYFRDDGDYGDHTTGNYNDFWGLHLWGDIDESIEWTAPKPFLGEDEYGRFAWVKLLPDASNVGFIVHRGDVKDGTDADRFFNPGATPEIWLKNDDATTYTSQAAAQGYATIHYHRDDGDYGDPTGSDYNDFWGLHLWGEAIDPAEGTDWTNPKPFDGVDDFGAFWNIQLQDPSQPLNFIIHRGDTKDPGPDQAFIPQDMATAWIMSADETIYSQQGAAQGFVKLHYHRPAGDYGDYTSGDYNDFWGLHTWAAADDPGWTTPRKPASDDTFGVAFEVPLFENATEMGYILHRGDEKDPGPDQFLNFDTWGYEVWQLQAEEVGTPNDPQFVYPLLSEPGANPGNISVQRAYWVDEKTILWSIAEDSSLSYKLHYAPEGGLEATDSGIMGGQFITLGSGSVSDAVAAKFPHLAELPALEIAADDLAMVPDILKGQIAISAANADGQSVDATGLQIPGVLDDLYAADAYDEQLGISWDDGVPTIRVWAPTAKSVVLHLFDDADPATTGTAMPMTLDPMSGVWSIEGVDGWKDKYYLFDVEVYVHSTGQVEHNLVTDPYSLSLAMNSSRSQIVDLNDAALKPAGWDEAIKPPLTAPEDISIYEIHVRDFSVNDPLVPEELKGTFKAFTLDGTYGTNHLKALQEAGLSHLHLLPAFDIATINEDKSQWQLEDWGELAGYPPDGEQQQSAIADIENLDAFNWGYDPFHYTTPEGSYSTNPDGTTRILEFREMVQAINEDLGLRVVMDVVYNHTNAAGQDEKSVLDKVVPGYYHRLDDKGAITTSTCCQNTATEHDMMEKLMIDSLVVWAEEYKIDAFRFDLMGHHMKRNMLKVQAALQSIDPDIYIYGEGWNFGEVADNARGVNATQLNMAGTGIGTFSDRLRDAVRGGGPFDTGDDLVRNQGFANGLFYDPNEMNATVPEPGPEPSSVTVAGSLQSEIGCPGDWQPDCAASHLTYDAADTVWQQTFAIPAGSWEYKVTIDDSWAENYGANGQPDGPNIPLGVATATDVKFYYSDATHWVTDNVNAIIANVPGSFQDELGCPGDWQPDCLRSWLQDPDGDGIYEFSTGDIPPGDYEAKVAIDENWAENYGADGQPNGPNILFSVEAGQEVLFSYDAVTHVLTISTASSDQLARLLLLTDQIRVGMAGNLAGYQFIDRNGDLVTGSDVKYNDQPAGYTMDPQEDITYISKHDNQTLYDNNAYKIPLSVGTAERVRVQNVGLSTVLLGQGVPFMHAGSDLLRSKSFDRDSFNSGDWFNKLDFTYQGNNFGVGLPVAGKNQENWPIMQPRLADEDEKLTPTSENIMTSAALFQELLAIRESSPLFRLRTAEEVQARVSFHNTGRSQIPGLIVMTISDLIEPDLDAEMEQIVVLINANDEEQNFTLAESAKWYLDLHRVQQESVDPVVKMASFDQTSGTFSVPGRTAAVFVEYTPQTRIEFLIDDVEALVAAGVLNEGQGNALIVKLEGAIDKLDRGQAHASVNQLEAFVNQVYDFMHEGILSPGEGQHLVDAANSIINQINDLY